MNLSPLNLALKIALTLAIGLLIGFEREWSNKDLGVRTFALTALAGFVAASLSYAMAVAVFLGIVAIVVLANVRQLRAGQNVELTTATALILTYVLAAAVGRGYDYPPVAIAILATLLLNWKFELHRFAGGLHPNEFRSAVWLGVLAFIIYPLLPKQPLWGLVNLHGAWVATVVVAAVGFGNYILLRLYSTRGIYYSAVLGGIVNSTLTAFELGTSLRTGGDSDAAFANLADTAALLVSLAMLVRNLVLLAIFSPPAALIAAPPMGVMVLLGFILLWRSRPSGPVATGQQLNLPSPLSFRLALSFGAVFLAVEILGTLAMRHFNHGAFYLVSVAGGLLSSASTTTAAGEMAAAHTLTPVVAGIATLLASATSTMANTVALQRGAGHPLGRRLWLTKVSVAVSGIAVLPLLHWLHL